MLVESMRYVRLWWEHMIGLPPHGPTTVKIIYINDSECAWLTCVYSKWLFLTAGEEVLGLSTEAAVGLGWRQKLGTDFAVQRERSRGEGMLGGKNPTLKKWSQNFSRVPWSVTELHLWHYTKYILCGDCYKGLGKYTLTRMAQQLK